MWATGDSQAGAELIERHSVAVFRFLRNKVPEHAIDELSQVIFEACARGIESFREEASFRTYLYRIACNRIVDFYRKQHRAVSVVDIDVLTHSIEDLGAGPSTWLARREEQRILINALRRLPLQDQIVLELFYWEDMTAAEIGEVMNVVEPTVRGRLRAAKKRLAELYQETSAAGPRGEDTEQDVQSWLCDIRGQLAKS
ncbi:sigma-70 family RNA polymerase sigma factor [Nannocystis sp. RBIL2]|uniref:RNA polymerase sigma factor n=1 Tax=Nannocystis sp. RBIL2 TaxID=2996788 RepID=UPI0022715FC3|nr:sigma-70 family RNA polymerase sigma factor [Nannocystis sp. RBIL2]MCY1071188.1 sigma-70 family RNA polymerase sigma factor [Nannocystis sp. RBIL2]